MRITSKLIEDKWLNAELRHSLRFNIYQDFPSFLFIYDYIYFKLKNPLTLYKGT